MAISKGMIARIAPTLTNVLEFFQIHVRDVFNVLLRIFRVCFVAKESYEALFGPHTPEIDNAYFILRDPVCVLEIVEAQEPCVCRRVSRAGIGPLLVEDIAVHRLRLEAVVCVGARRILVEPVPNN